MTKIQTPIKFELLILVIGWKNLSKLCKLPHYGTVKSYRGPDRIEGNNEEAATMCTSWFSTPALMFGKDWLEKK